MPRLFVLDVPEFASLPEVARSQSRYRVTQAANHYWCLECDDEIVLSRRGLRLKPAVWFGVLTGGFDGEIVEFTRNVLRIAAQKQPQRDAQEAA
jgi:hypothetical protein